MPRTITISLPVEDLKASRAFYDAIGFSSRTDFADAGAALMVWSETISVILLTHEKWRTLTARPIPPKSCSEVGLAVSCESREQVDAMNAAAAAHGGTADINPIEDYPSMYGRDFADPDGDVWGAKWMDVSALPSAND